MKLDWSGRSHVESVKPTQPGELSLQLPLFSEGPRSVGLFPPTLRIVRVAGRFSVMSPNRPAHSCVDTREIDKRRGPG